MHLYYVLFSSKSGRLVKAPSGDALSAFLQARDVKPVNVVKIWLSDAAEPDCTVDEFGCLESGTFPAGVADFSVRAIHGDWFIMRGERVWHPVGFDSEWEAIDFLAREEPDAAAGLEAMHRRVG